ncbi:hypothetical protein V6N13_038066 [Hibiscus sabdariffa]|uniref:Ubiquitinyl hydrolase 1 n=1 Tax=Hibiscus sabdariffa TaxID=183260 RepID=A0ABR2S360_9ROSI
MNFLLSCQKLHNYDDVVEKPKPQPIKYRGVEHLSDMLLHYNQTSDILYYEVLDIPLPELQGLKTLKVAFHHATKDEVELSHPGAELRLLEVFYHKIYKIFPPNEKVENINDQYWTLRAEEWKFAFLSLAHPDYLQDSDVVATRFQRRGVYGAWEQYLGLEHSDNAPKRWSYAANQV